MTVRGRALTTANELIHSDRNLSYGEPTANFSNIAALWSTQFGHKLKEPFSRAEVAQALVLLKMARMIASPKADTYIDAAGYIACGLECEVAEGRIEEDSV